MWGAVHLIAGLAGAASFAIAATAVALEGPGGTGGPRSTVSPYPGRPVPGRPIPTRPSPYNSIPTIERPAIAPLKGNAGRDLKPNQPTRSYRSYGGTSRTPAECQKLADRAMDSNDEELWKRYRACTDMTAD